MADMDELERRINALESTVERIESQIRQIGERSSNAPASSWNLPRPLRVRTGESGVSGWARGRDGPAATQLVHSYGAQTAYTEPPIGCSCTSSPMAPCQPL